MKRLLTLVLATASFCISSQNTLDANMPEKLATFSTHTLEITINKGPISSFSKYQLDVPDNVTVKEGTSQNGHFSFDGKRAKLVWVESPKTGEFTVSMVLIIGNASGKGNFEHRYYYIDGETKKEISDASMEVEFISGTATADYNLALNPPKDPVKPSNVNTPTITPPKNEEPKKVSISIPPSNPVTTTAPTPTLTSSTLPNSSNTTPVSIPEVKEYKIQIGSFSSKPNFSKYGNIGKLSVIQENGVYKLMAGSFKTKEEAVKRMEELKTQGYPGFVVLFVNGEKAK